jgi:hypothetical protein
MLGAYPEPLILMLTQLFGLEFSPTRVAIVVAMNLSVALEAYRYRILNFITPAALCRDDVVRLNLDSAKPMANAASPVAPGE